MPEPVEKFILNAVSHVSAPPIPLQCSSCRHLRGLVAAPSAEARGGEADAEPCCDAFPRGIPEDIQDGTFDHAYAHLGDHGIRFEPAHLTLVPSP